MRRKLLVLLAATLLVSMPALAGTVTATNNQVNWQSTQCKAPDVPASFSSLPRHATAEQANQRITVYNNYVQAAQTYMDCLSNEAQSDSKSLSDAIAASAQHMIDDERKSVADLGAPLQKK